MCAAFSQGLECVALKHIRVSVASSARCHSPKTCGCAVDVLHGAADCHALCHQHVYKVVRRCASDSRAACAWLCKTRITIDACRAAPRVCLCSLARRSGEGALLVSKSAMRVISNMILRGLLLISLLWVSSALSLDMVISHYQEPLLAVQAFVSRAQAALTQVDTFRVFFYTQGTLNVSGVPASWTVTHLSPNRGTENHGYIHFLAHQKWETADFVWFSQAIPDHYMADKLWIRLPLLTNRTGMLALALIDRCSCDECGGGSMGLRVRLREIYAMANHAFCHGSWPAFYNGEFIVSKKRIQAQSEWLYRYLLTVLEAGSDHFTHEDVKYYPPADDQHAPVTSTPEKPLLGHTLERSWNMLFRCFDATRCCEENVTACEPDFCQCLD